MKMFWFLNFLLSNLLKLFVLSQPYPVNLKTLKCHSIALYLICAYEISSSAFGSIFCQSCTKSQVVSHQNLKSFHTICCSRISLFFFVCLGPLLNPFLNLMSLGINYCFCLWCCVGNMVSGCSSNINQFLSVTQGIQTVNVSQNLVSP